MRRADEGIQKRTPPIQINVSVDGMSHTQRRGGVVVDDEAVIINVPKINSAMNDPANHITRKMCSSTVVSIILSERQDFLEHLAPFVDAVHQSKDGKRAKGAGKF